jgi:hypothetical protein
MYEILHDSEISFNETEFENVDWIHLGQDRHLRWSLVNMVMDCRVKFLDYLSDHELLKQDSALHRTT